MNKKSKIYLTLGAVVLIGYISCGFLLVVFQERIVYLKPNRPFAPCEDLATSNMITQGGTRMYHQNDGHDTVVIFYHGNGNVACDAAFMSNHFLVSGADYIFPEYEGYGGDGNVPSHHGVKRTVVDIIDYVKTQSYDEVMIIGQSIGTAASSYHVSLEPPDKVFLVSPMLSIEHAAKMRFPIYPVQFFVDNAFDNAALLKSYTGDIVIAHGSRDISIPSKSGRLLFERLHTEQKEFILVDGASHSSMLQEEIVIQAIKDHIRKEL